jgi:hypothetical protein
MATVAAGVTGSSELTERVEALEPREDGRKVTATVQLALEVRVFGKELPQGEGPPFRFKL